jgi:hypothetical protein
MRLHYFSRFAHVSFWSKPAILETAAALLLLNLLAFALPLALGHRSLSRADV